MFKKLLELVGIQLMKAEEAVEDSIDKIDRAKLAIKKDEERLTILESNLEQARKNYAAQSLTRQELENDLKQKENQLKEIVSNYSLVAKKDNPNATTEDIKAFVSSKLTEDLNFDLLKQSIDTIHQKITIALDVEEKHRIAVDDVKVAVNEVRKAVAYNKNQLEIIQSQRTAAQATEEAAALSSLASATSTARIEEAKKANIMIQASAEAKREGARDNPNVSMQLDSALHKSRAANMSESVSALIDASIDESTKQITR